jgi:hypothetical protein
VTTVPAATWPVGELASPKGQLSFYSLDEQAKCREGVLYGRVRPRHLLPRDRVLLRPADNLKINALTTPPPSATLALVYVSVVQGQVAGATEGDYATGHTRRPRGVPPFHTHQDQFWLVDWTIVFQDNPLTGPADVHEAGLIRWPVVHSPSTRSSGDQEILQHNDRDQQFVRFPSHHCQARRSRLRTSTTLSLSSAAAGDSVITQRSLSMAIGDSPSRSSSWRASARDSAAARFRITLEP